MAKMEHNSISGTYKGNGERINIRQLSGTNLANSGNILPHISLINACNSYLTSIRQFLFHNL